MEKIKPLREIRKIKNDNKRKYIYLLQERHRIKTYFNLKGYKCYDPVEFVQYKKTRKMGRPIKILKYKED